MQHFTMDDILSNHNDWGKISTAILSKKLLNYKVDKVQEGKITIEFEYEDNSNFSREFFYTDTAILMEDISKQAPVDLKYCYIKDFDYKKAKNRNTLKKFAADFAFFDGVTSFQSAKFNAEASFHCAIFSGKTSFENVVFDANAIFKATTFCDEVSFAMTEFCSKALFELAAFQNESFFKAALFHDEVSFDMAIFSAEASFVVSTFDAKATFERAAFIAEASFYNSIFKKEASFERTILCDEVSFKAAKFIEEASFDYASFSAGTSFDYTSFDAIASFYNAKFDGQASFLEAVFGDAVIFSNTLFGDQVSFSGATFHVEASFGRASFVAGVSFDNSKFHCAASFKAARFNADGSFYHSTFDGDASFEAAVFSGCTILEKAIFLNSVLFEKTIFGNKISFKETVFTEPVSFGDVDFSGETVFNETKFSNGVHFKNCTADSILFRKYIFQNDSDFEFERINKLVFNNCIIKSTFNLKNFTDYSTNPLIERPIRIEKLSFKNTQNLGRINIDWEKNKVEKAIYSNDDTYEEKKEQFAMLKENYHSIGDYSSEDKAFVAYMRCRRETLSNWFIRNLDKLIDTIGKYGTKPSRIVITMIIVWLFFGFIFSISAYFNGILANDHPVSLLNGFYFSATTFFTIGYGDIVPASLYTKITAPIEGALGLFLMSYFTVAVVRKTLR